MERKTAIRDLIAFWIFGLANNYGYIIMLSAAEDIISKHDVNFQNQNVTEDVCEVKITQRTCRFLPTGAVLLADIIPALLVKITFPFFMQRIPFGFRHFIICLSQLVSYLLVAFSGNFWLSLFGVCFASFGAGLGESCFLSLSAYYKSDTILAWSSGTGGAGIVGSIAYAVLTEHHFANLEPRTALLSMLIVPLIFAWAYWFLLTPTPFVHKMNLFDSNTWIVPARSKEGFSNVSLKKLSTSEPPMEKIVLQKDLSFFEKIKLTLPLCRYMIPLGIVYYTEYLINQGLSELTYFDCAHGFSLTRSSQYRWYQVLYQVGVFISRSSVKFVQLSAFSLYMLPIFQTLNVIIFFYNAFFEFIPHIGIVFLFIFFEGCLGGAAYVNTFMRVHKEADPEVREISMSIASLSDSCGVVASGFTSFPVHNYICSVAFNKIVEKL